MKSMTCPKCNETIETLDFEELSRDTSTFNIEYEDYSRNGDYTIDELYRCPECKEVVFTSEQDMLKYIEEQEPE